LYSCAGGCQHAIAVSDCTTTTYSKIHELLPLSARLSLYRLSRAVNTTANKHHLNRGDPTMYKLILPAAALLAMTFTFASADTAEARGFHFNNGRVHVDIGNPHGFHNGHAGHGFHGGVSHTIGYRGFYQPYVPSHTWHDTSHWDYHPTEYRWHGNHWDVQPGHYDWHQEGHVDHNHP